MKATHNGRLGAEAGFPVESICVLKATHNDAAFPRVSAAVESICVLKATHNDLTRVIVPRRLKVSVF